MRPRTEVYHCIHGEWLTTSEAARRLGVARQTLQGYRYEHHCILEDAYDHYDALNRGWIQRGKPGPKPKTYRLRGKDLTVAEAAEALRVPLSTMYKTLYRHRGDLNAAARALEKKREEEAAREILRIIRK